jgi:hypothetical protein
MAGRTLLSEGDYIDPAYEPYRPEMVRRRAVLRETVDRFLTAEPKEKYHTLANTNVQRWYKNRRISPNYQCVQVIRGDWGQVTLSLTQEYGVCFAVLNMVNAFVLMLSQANPQLGTQSRQFLQVANRRIELDRSNDVIRSCYNSV